MRRINNMKYILQTDNETIEIPIIRSKRKTLGLEVKYDGTVNARVPMRAPREIIKKTKMYQYLTFRSTKEGF